MHLKTEPFMLTHWAFYLRRKRSGDENLTSMRRLLRWLTSEYGGVSVDKKTNKLVPTPEQMRKIADILRPEIRALIKKRKADKDKR